MSENNHKLEENREKSAVTENIRNKVKNKKSNRDDPSENRKKVLKCEKMLNDFK